MAGGGLATWPHAIPLAVGLCPHGCAASSQAEAACAIPPPAPAGVGKVGPGGTAYINDTIALHAVRCDDVACGAAGEEGAVSLHVYAPPIRRVKLYEQEENRWAGEGGEWVSMGAWWPVVRYWLCAAVHAETVPQRVTQHLETNLAARPARPPTHLQGDGARPRLCHHPWRGGHRAAGPVPPELLAVTPQTSAAPERRPR